MGDSITNKYIDIINKFIPAANDYMTYLATTIEGHNPEDYKTYMQAIKNIKASLKILQKNTPTTVCEYIEFFDRLSDVQSNMETILKIINNEFYTNAIITNMSQTFIDSIEYKIANLKALFNDMNDNEFFEKNDQIFNNYALDITKTYNGNNKLVVYLMKLRLKKTTNKTERVFILNMIEQLKNDVLQVPPKPENAPILIRHSLIPITDSTLLGNLVKKGASTIIFSKAAAKNPIEFSVLPLISTEYVVKNNLFNTASISWLDDISLKRYDNIKLKTDYISNADQQWTVKWNDDNPLSDKIYILETNDNLTYRILAPSFDTPYVSREVAKKIFSGHNGRAFAYNKIMSDYILTRAYDASLSNLVVEYEKKSQNMPDLNTLKKNITAALIKTLPVQNIKSADDYKNLINDKSSISAAFIKTLYEFYQIDKNNIELSLSFLNTAHNLGDQFYKQLKKIFNGVAPNERIYIEKPEDVLSQFILAHFKDIINKIFKAMDNTKHSWRDLEFSLKEYVFITRAKNII